MLQSNRWPSNYSHALPTLERGGERLFFVGFHKNQSDRPGPPTEHIDKRLLLGDKNSPGKSLRWPPKAVMTFRKRRVSHSRYNGNEIDDTLWISLVAVSSAIMKRVGTGGYKGLLPTEMNTLYSEVPGAPNYTEEGFSSMFYHEIDEPALPNQRPSDIGLATKHGLERSGLYFAAKFYDLETFKKSWKRIPTSVQDKLKRAKADGGYGLDINYLKSFFSGANHFQRRSDLFK